MIIRRFILIALMTFIGTTQLTYSQNISNLLDNLISEQDYISRRISSFDRTGGNRDAFPVEPGETLMMADISGPGIIHHIWVTISAESFYGKKIVLRIYWDGEENPSVEAPIGDFFGVGHGLNRNYASLPFVCTSEGRARNCFWHMPFRKSAKITVTNEGSRRVSSFYYYVDYREVKNLPENTRYFHAHYRQEFPPEQVKFDAEQPRINLDGKDNYLFFEAKGAGHYVGVSYSILNRNSGWWGEGDDFIWIDGEKMQSLNGTGSEDYFCDAWGMRESQSLFYGCPLQEPGYDPGDKATVYRFHISDPIPFTKSIKVSIEHGHANDRTDYLSSVAYWYQKEPHQPFPKIPAVEQRLPYAIEVDKSVMPFSIFEYSKGVKVLTDSLLYYDSSGKKLSQALVNFSQSGDTIDFNVNVPYPDKYIVSLMLTKGPDRAQIAIGFDGANEINYDGYSSSSNTLEELSLGEQILENTVEKFHVRCEGKNALSNNFRTGLVSIKIEPVQEFIKDWYIIGPFENPVAAGETQGLFIAYPPENETKTDKDYLGKDKQNIHWQRIKAEESGFVDFNKIFSPNNDYAVAYGLTYVWSPVNRPAHILVGSDDGVRVWVNNDLVHHNLVKRGAVPDNDTATCNLKKGWNRLLVKVEDAEISWGFYLRIPDPKNELKETPDK